MNAGVAHPAAMAVSRPSLKFGRDRLLLLEIAVRDYPFRWEVSIPK